MLLNSCTPTNQPTPFLQSQFQQPVSKGFHLQTLHAEEPGPLSLQRVATPPGQSDFELRFQTSATSGNTVRVPEQGSFQVKLEAGNNFAVLDGDGTDDGQIRIQVPAQTFDLFLRPEAAETPALCAPPQTNSTPVLDRMDQLVQAKANDLIAQGQGQCVYLPPLNQRQNANCNSTSSGLQCSGPLNKTIQSAQCPEIAVYAGAMNLNNALPNSKLYVAVQNNLTLNQSAQGIFSSRGNLNTSLNGSSSLEGIFVSGASSNLNLGGSPVFKGLYSLPNASGMSMNLNQNARFEGAFCSTGNVNLSRNGTSQLHYQPALLEPWLADVPELPNMLCPARNNFYTQTTPLDCSQGTAPATLQLTDALYGIDETLSPDAAMPWYVLPRRALPIPDDWDAPEGSTYVLDFENQGSSAWTLRWVSQSAPALVPAAVKVIPAVDCVRPNADGSSTAYLSYVNLLSGPVSLPFGENNQLLPSGLAQQPPQVFATGQSPVFPNSPHAVTFASESLSWQLGARTVTVQADDPNLQCPSLSPDLLISNVQLSETGDSIMGADASASLTPDYAGRDVALTLKGSFLKADQEPFSLTDFLFTLAPPLVQQTFIGTEPQARVLLDDSILLETTAVSSQEIQAVLHTRALPDLYLKGLHKLSVEQGDWYTDTLIQIGDPEPVSGLQPRIDSVEVLRDAQGTPLHLRLEGEHFMLQPKFSYTTIDGEFGFGFQTEARLDGSFQTIVHIPDPQTFDNNPQHQLVMATPFGVAVKEF